jgi:hypothetical protein
MAKLSETKPLPSVERLRELLAYDPETGFFHWRRAIGSQAAGNRAGTVQWSGYVVIAVDRVLYLAHRLAWKMQTGNDPLVFVDHANRDKADNRWVNLRAADLSENRRNSIANRNNKSGFKGVHWQPSHKKWRAEITVNGKRHHIGHFATPELAAEARAKAAALLHGAFAREM